MLHDLETLCSIPAADVAGGLVAIQNMQKKVLLFVFFFFFFFNDDFYFTMDGVF